MCDFTRSAACECSSHCPSSCFRNLHCRPTLIAGISLHSAQRQTARVDIPSHFATAAVVSNGSKLDNDFPIRFSCHCDSFLRINPKRAHRPKGPLCATRKSAQAEGSVVRDSKKPHKPKGPLYAFPKERPALRPLLQAQAACPMPVARREPIATGRAHTSRISVSVFSRAGVKAAKEFSNHRRAF